jgi:hypothetical protein
VSVVTNWTEVAAIAEFVAAAVLTVSAGALIASAVETGSLARKTETLGIHAQLDREMRYRPYIVATAVMHPGVRPTCWDVFLRNAGVGPALECSLAFVGDSGEIGQRRNLVLDSGERLQFTLVKTEVMPHPEGLFNPPAGLSVPGGSRNLAVVCTDVLGIHWRFLNGMTPESWRPTSDEPAPAWTAW